MRGGDSWRRVLVAAVVAAVLTGCGLSPHRVDGGEVRALERWLVEQPQVESVDTELGSDFRSGLPGKDEWARTRVVTVPGATPEELLALGEALRARDDPRTIDNVVEARVDGLSLHLGRSAERDARAVELLVGVQDALGDIRTYPQPDRYSQDPPAVTIDDRISVWVERGDVDRAAVALSEVVPPDGEEVTVAVDTVSDGPHRVIVIGGERGTAYRGALDAVQDMASAGLRPSLGPQHGQESAMQIQVEVAERDQWDRAVAALAEHAPEAVLSTSLPASVVPGLVEPVEVELSLTEVSADDARTLPELIGAVPDPWPVGRVELTADGEGLVTVDRTEADLADLEALVDVPSWELSDVVTSYRFVGVNNGVAADSHLLVPASGPVDPVFLAIHRAVARADAVHPDVSVTVTDAVRVDWPDGSVGAGELRPVLEALRGDWEGQRVQLTALDQHRHRTTVAFDTSGSGEAEVVRAVGGGEDDPVEQLGWALDVWNDTARG